MIAHVPHNPAASTGEQSPSASASASLSLVPDSAYSDTSLPSTARSPRSPNLLPYHDNDDGNAKRLIAMYGDQIRYCHPFKKWLVWDGRRWLADRTQQVIKLARRAMGEFHSQALSHHNTEKLAFANSSLSARSVRDMVSFVQSDRHVSPDALDADPFSLNFLNGTLDLRTLVLRPHRPLDYITHLVHHRYDPSAACPHWLQFLDQITASTPGLIPYLQDALGYTLSGSTIEKAVFILHGKGRNGKTTMLSVFRHLIYEYSTMVQIESLMSKGETSNSQADLADLRGKRFAQTSETEKGARLAQGKLKRLCQGAGLIKATRKYENPTEFLETHKLWMDTNHRPDITDAEDKALFDRLHLIPFTVRIPKSKVDRFLSSKLLAEADGILAWAAAGAARCFENGLTRPDAVEKALQEWKRHSDWMERFIRECCMVGKSTLSVGAKALYAAYETWVEAGGEAEAHRPYEFYMRLKERDDISKKHTKVGSTYFGVCLKPIRRNGRVGSSPAEQIENDGDGDETDD